MAKCRRGKKRPPTSERETYAGRIKLKIRRRLEHPLDFVWRKFLATALPSIEGRNGSIDIPREKGWALIAPGTIPLTAEIMEACLGVVDERKHLLNSIIEQKKADKESYFYDVVGPEGFKTISEIVINYISQPVILHGVMRYLRDFPLLQGVKLFWTPRNDKMVSSQQWHIDGVDTRQVKCFLYLNDIGQGAGPLTILSSRDSRQVMKKYDHFKGRLSDEQVAACIPRERWTQLTGSRGTLVACDTSSCFHFGGRAREGERLFLEFHYTTSGPFFVNEIPSFPAKSWRQRMLLAD